MAGLGGLALFLDEPGGFSERSADGISSACYAGRTPLPARGLRPPRGRLSSDPPLGEQQESWPLLGHVTIVLVPCGLSNTSQVAGRKATFS